MTTQPLIRVQTEDFDLSTEVAALRAQQGQVGAVVAFVGTVRDMNSVGNATGQGGDAVHIRAMELEHYPGMTEKALHDIVAQAKARWQIVEALVIHRVGPLLPLDQIVLVAVISAHRGEAFAACEFIMDYLKTAAPFWKKETTPHGAHWVDARESDDSALQKWGISSNNAATTHP